MGPKSKIKKDKIEPKNDLGMENMKNYGRRRKRNLTFNLLDPNQIRLTLWHTDYF